MSVTREFPNYDPATLPMIPELWADVSWHNDCAPSWLYRDLVVFIDFAEISDREFGQENRFTVNHKDTCETVFEGNDWQAVVNFVEQYNS